MSGANGPAGSAWAMKTPLSICDLSDPENPRRVAQWVPQFPTRNMQLIPHPPRKSLVLVHEDSTGMRIHFADFSNPLQPKLLSSVPTNGEGNRVAAWGRKAIYTRKTRKDKSMPRFMLQ